MDLQLGQKVNASDGLVGALSNIVVDPTTNRVTHIIVDPPIVHRRERLIPISAVRDGQTSGSLLLDLSRQEFKQLQAISYSELVNLGSDVEARGDWSTGNQDVWGLPYWGAKLEFTTTVDRVAVAYHRIPKGDCEIRRSSNVITADGESVGSVAGLALEGQDITGVIVRSDRHRRLVPIQSVTDVANDAIILSDDTAGFDSLPAIRATSAFSRFFARPPARQRDPFPPL